MPTSEQISFSQQNRQEITAGYPLGARYLPIDDAVSTLEAAQVRATFPLMHGSLQLGVAENGLPILVDLYDPAPGPFLGEGS